MADFWIITARDFFRHRDLGSARAEQERLSDKVPGKAFRILRCKTEVEPRADTRAHIARLEAMLRRMIEWIESGAPTGPGLALHEETAALLSPAKAAPAAIETGDGEAATAPIGIEALPLDMHRALAEAGYAPLDGYLERRRREGGE